MKTHVFVCIFLFTGFGVASAQSVTVTPYGASSTSANDGRLKIEVEGIEPPYSYAVYPYQSAPVYGSNLQSSPIYVHGLKAGKCYVYVSSEDGCTASGTVTIVVCNTFEPFIQVLSDCTSPYSSLKAVVKSGTYPPFSYFWFRPGRLVEIPMGDQQILNDVSPGMEVCIRVSDPRVCTSIEKCITVQNNLYYGVASITPYYCGNLGAIDLDASSGYGAVSYKWSNGAATQDISNLSSGSYCVTITDGLCTKISCYTVPDNSPVPSISVNNVKPTCQGKSQGAIDIGVSGGSSFTYRWSNNYVTQDVQSLTKGTYCVTVTNNCGKSTSRCFDITNYSNNCAYSTSNCRVEYCYCSQTGELVSTTTHASNTFVEWATCKLYESCPGGGSQFLAQGFSDKRKVVEAVEGGYLCHNQYGCTIGGTFYKQYEDPAYGAGIGVRVCDITGCPQSKYCGWWVYCGDTKTDEFICDDMSGRYIINQMNRSRNHDLWVYPNPVRDVLNIKLDMATDATVRLLLYDTWGKMVKNENLQVLQGENMFALDMGSNLYNGMYYICVVDQDNNIISTKKIIKTK